MADRSGEHFGNYRLVRLLGQGGFAEVYLGQHLRLNQQAAIKVLHAHLTDAEAEHFQQEAQTISTLIHPSIVRVFDYDVQDGVPFLVMDYAPNGSLRQRYPKGSVVPLPATVTCVKQVAEALQYAHEQKFIHRDIKPENMLLGRRDEVLLSDFGIATIAHSSGSLSTKEAVGTLVYMAPEQIEGHPRAASDQYALGCAVYEWLCGSRPFEGSPTEVMVQQLSMPPPPLHEKVATISPEVEQVVLRALAKDPKARFASVHDFAAALENVSQHAYAPTAFIPGEQPMPGSPAAAAFATIAMPGETPADPDTPLGLPGNGALAATTPAAPFLATTPAPAEVPSLPRPAQPQRRRTLSGLPAALLIGLAVLVVAGGVLGSVSLLAHFGVIGARSTPPAATAVRGGTWTADLISPLVYSLLPNQGNGAQIDDALYLPLFGGDAQGAMYPAAATEIPTVQNGGISADGKTWIFHLRPHLVWSDGQPYDARDVDYTWKLWANPQFPADFIDSVSQISSATVSADHLSITFHLKQAYAPFLAEWVGGIYAPWPAHYFSVMSPQAILKSPDLLNPRVTSGPFMMAESVPIDHFTMVHNPRYYQAREGLPYLDKVIIRFVDENTILKDLQAGIIDSASILDVSKVPLYQRLINYTVVTPPTDSYFEALYFNFHNTVLAHHPEVRQAIAMAIDHQALIQGARQGFASPLCTDHPSAIHPGYQPNPNCPDFNPTAATKLLSDNGWVKGPDGVRARGGQRLEFEYSGNITDNSWRVATEAVVQRNLQVIGIKLDIQNYPQDTFFGSFLTGGKASPPTGAVAGRYDIAEFGQPYWYDPDDSSFFACDQFPPNGGSGNIDFYCNPSLDALYKQELATVDTSARQQIFNQIHDIYLTEFPFVTLFSAPTIMIVRKGTHNYMPGPYVANNNPWQWWCDHGKC